MQPHSSSLVHLGRVVPELQCIWCMHMLSASCQGCPCYFHPPSSIQGMQFQSM